MADEYSKRAMPPDHEVRYRDKLASRLLAGVLLSMSAASGALGIGVLAGIDPAVPAWFAVVPFAVAVGIGLVGLAGSVLRIAVTDDALYVDTGMLHRRVPLGAISELKLLDSSQGKITGYEILAPAAGKGSRFVGVKWMDGDVEHALATNGTDPQALFTHLERVTRRVRVEVDEAVGEEEAEAEEALATDDEESVEDRA